MGKPVVQAILDGAQQIAVPALVSTLCICIVFLPMFFLGGVARYLFVPLAEAVVFAMLASYLLSRTLVPTHRHDTCSSRRSRARPPSRGTRWPARSRRSSAGSSGCGSAYRRLLTLLVDRRGVFIPVFLAVCLSASLLAAAARRELLPRHRQRPVHPPSPRPDRHPHRGDRAAEPTSWRRDPA